jgi:DNA-directed RNA polymerase specialized sigma24 family protein
MMTHSMPSQQPGDDPPGKPGRKLGPIADGVGTAHRAWLEPLRARLLASGLTISGLAQRAGWPKSKVSELLRGVGQYPRWEITHSLLHVLGIPTWPMRRLWSAAALQARKKQEWIDGCIERVVLSTGPDVPPVDHLAFAELNRTPYTAYARVFLRDACEADQVVAETFDVLWLQWEEALASADVQKFAWQVLRQSVMARTPHTGGHPELVPAAFDTVALHRTTCIAEQFAQIEESIALFKALSHLPGLQLDVMILKHLRGMDDTAVADVLGVPVASVSSADRHAKRSLTEALSHACQEEPTHERDR